MSTLAVRYGRTAESKKKTAGDTPAYTETLLWTNPNTSTARTSLDATLSESLRGYKYVRIQYSYNTSSTSAPFSVIFPIFKADGETYMFPSGTQQQRMVIGLNNASGNVYIRNSCVTSDTVIHFANAHRVNASGNTNTNLIPWYIYGIK